MQVIVMPVLSMQKKKITNFSSRYKYFKMNKKVTMHAGRVWLGVQDGMGAGDE